LPAGAGFATVARGRALGRIHVQLSFVDIFVLVSGSFGIFTSLPLAYLALRSYRDAKDLRRIQVELAGLMVESKELAEEVAQLQREIHRDQRVATDRLQETKQTVDRVARVTLQRRRRLPRVRVTIS